MISSGRGWWALGALVIATAAPAVAESEDARDRVSFAVQRTREVANDWVTAVVGVTHEDSDPARLADRINRDMSWALEIARAKSGVRVQSGGYQTVPIQDPKRAQLRHWRASQDLVLEASDVKPVADLVGELQARLQLRSIVFSVSPERRRQVDDELLDEALEAFQARAERVRKKLGARGWRIVQIHLDSGGGPPPRPMMVRSLGAGEAAMATPPALEGGSSTLRAGANGTIELEF